MVRAALGPTRKRPGPFRAGPRSARPEDQHYFYGFLFSNEMVKELNNGLIFLNQIVKNEKSFSFALFWYCHD